MSADDSLERILGCNRPVSVLAFEVILLMCVDQERFVSRWITSNLNAETRSIAPDEVKRGGKFIEVRGPRSFLWLHMY